MDISNRIRYAWVVGARFIFIVGDTLFADALAQLLGSSPGLQVCGSAPTIAAALPRLEASNPDAVILAGVVSPHDALLARFMATHPAAPVIRTDPDSNAVEVIFSQRIAVHSTTDLLAIIDALPGRQP